jgi:isopentenyl diphosphate isomerase/L-lactate dehydrogenase-like FMN-dependent dehydrogenase
VDIVEVGIDMLKMMALGATYETAGRPMVVGVCDSKEIGER